MRNGVDAGFPHQNRLPALPSSRAPAVYQAAAPQMPAPQNSSAHARSNIARLFCDLRGALRATPHQVAAQLRTRPDIILALEAGQFEGLPTWNETARIVIAYTALAGIDGRPVLTAIADVVRSGVRSPVHPMIAAQQLAYAQPIHTPQAGHAPQAIQGPQSTYAPQAMQAPEPRPSRFRVGKLMQAGSALASGAKRLQGGAFQQVRRRPERALYAVSLPLGIVLILFNTTALEAAFSHVPRPVARMTQDVRQYFQERFAPVREGLRWIEVDDPRRRRGDKLR